MRGTDGRSLALVWTRDASSSSNYYYYYYTIIIITDLIARGDKEIMHTHTCKRGKKNPMGKQTSNTKGLLCNSWSAGRGGGTWKVLFKKESDLLSIHSYKDSDFFFFTKMNTFKDYYIAKYHKILYIFNFR